MVKKKSECFLKKFCCTELGIFRGVNCDSRWVFLRNQFTLTQ
ncbi:Uncharacterized protein APZ42_033638 [Daphnia magna]|uniref:Uncharacterized protein n=1 Tax=Daphnia magna TaxID=35525 RepID=A0A164KWS9_9CRUS|nr:Uncharacterized protein APZ42_033638 [Daphnia magna]